MNGPLLHLVGLMLQTLTAESARTTTNSVTAVNSKEPTGTKPTVQDGRGRRTTGPTYEQTLISERTSSSPFTKSRAQPPSPTPIYFSTGPISELLASPSSLGEQITVVQTTRQLNSNTVATLSTPESVVAAVTPTKFSVRSTDNHANQTPSVASTDQGLTASTGRSHIKTETFTVTTTSQWRELTDRTLSPTPTEKTLLTEIDSPTTPSKFPRARPSIATNSKVQSSPTFSTAEAEHITSTVSIGKIGSVTRSEVSTSATKSASLGLTDVLRTTKLLGVALRTSSPDDSAIVSVTRRKDSEGSTRNQGSALTSPSSPSVSTGEASKGRTTASQPVKVATHPADHVHDRTSESTDRIPTLEQGDSQASTKAVSLLSVLGASSQIPAKFPERTIKHTSASSDTQSDLGSRGPSVTTSSPTAQTSPIPRRTVSAAKTKLAVIILVPTIIILLGATLTLIVVFDRKRWKGKNNNSDTKSARRTAEWADTFLDLRNPRLVKVDESS